MKMVFFLIAFFLVCIRYYFSWTGKEGTRNGVSVSSMVVKTDDYVEEINYSGKFKLTDEETGFQSISPGGIFKYRFNDISVKAESNLRGEIEYTVYDGKNNLAPTGEGKIYITQAIRQMIDWGFDAEARLERVYQKGGSEALIKEVDSIKPDPVKLLYLNRLLRLDSGSSQEMPVVMQKISHLGNDQDKAGILEKFSAAQLQDSAINAAYFEAISSLGSDMEKVNVLDRMIRLDSLSKKNAENILLVSRSLGSDMDRSGLYEQMIAKDLITGPWIDTLLIEVEKMGSGMDKANLFGHLLAIKNMSDSQWIGLLHQVSLLNADMDKASLLSQIALIMPKNEAVRREYLKAARTIGNDTDYGKAVRAVE